MFTLKPLQKLQVILAGAVGATELPICVGFTEYSNSLAHGVEGGTPTVTTGGTAVDVISAPATGLRRTLKELSVYNADNASATVTVRINDSTVIAGTTRIIVALAIAVGETLCYSQSRGWYVLTTTGAQKTTASTDASSALSTAVSAGLGDSVTRSEAVSAGLATSVSTSAGTSNGLAASQTLSTAISDGLAASTAQSAAVSAGLADSVSRSEAISAGTSASVARSSISSGNV
jgi:hypothetical protein